MKRRNWTAASAASLSYLVRDGAAGLGNMNGAAREDESKAAARIRRLRREARESRERPYTAFEAVKAVEQKPPFDE